MNFLDNFVIPSGAEHTALLNILQVLTMLIFLPFTGMVLGGTVLSVYFNGRGIKENNPLYTRFAKDIMDKILVKKSAGFAFVVLPIATVTIIYAQFLMNAKIITVNFLVFSTLYYFIAITFLYRYKNSFLKNISPNKYLVFFRLARSGEKSDENKNEIIPSLSGHAYLGLIALFIGLFLFVCGATVVTEPGRWNTAGILKSVFNLPVWMNYIYLILASFSIAGSAILYFFFVWQGGIKDISDAYKKLVKNSVIPFTMIASVLQTLFLFGGIVLMPASAMSSLVYVYVTFALISILIVCNLLYGIYKNSEMRFAGVVFFIMFLTFTFTIVKDQLVLGNSVKEHLYAVNLKAGEYDKQKEALVITNTGVDAEQLYNQKCIACHKFDTKLVGPPYKETVPKYNGDVKKLSEFIYNPTKINPDYPSMPSQGLKKKEADAMAKWLMEKTNH
jgi:cytochrome c